MKTQSEKALAAVREYDRLMTEIANNKRAIYKALDCCTRLVWENGFCSMPDGVKSHLSDAFEPYEYHDGYLPNRQYNTPDEIAEIIGECDGCKNAYAAIIERKENRKKLGIIKRSLRAIARGKASQHDLSKHDHC